MKKNQNMRFNITSLRALTPRLLCLALTTLSLAAQAYSPPVSGLVSWWRAENNALDAAGANHGTALDGLAYSPGLSGAAFSLNGVGSNVRVPQSSSLNVGTGNGFTVGMWIKPASFNLQDLFEWNNGAGFIGVHMTLNVPNLGGGEGSLWANIVDTSGGDHALSSTTGLISTNAFQHVALSYDKLSGQAKLYLNGSIIAAASLGTFNPQTSSDAFFGIRPSGPFTGIWYGGMMDEVTLYNRALTGNEVATLATVPEPASSAMLIIAAGYVLARRCRN